MPQVTAYAFVTRLAKYVVNTAAAGAAPELPSDDFATFIGQATVVAGLEVLVGSTKLEIQKIYIPM